MSNVHVTVLKNAPARSPKQEIQATAATAQLADQVRRYGLLSQEATVCPLTRTSYQGI